MVANEPTMLAVELAMASNSDASAEPFSVPVIEESMASDVDSVPAILSPSTRSRCV